MAEVLSQKEIDALLNNVQDGSEEQFQQPERDKDVIPFDFRLPNRISKNQLRSLRNIHESFSESFSSFLVTKLQSIVNISVTSVDQIYYSEYVLSVANPACLFTFDIKNTDIKGIFEVGPDLAMVLVDMLLGGLGDETAATKNITPIEQKVISGVVERAMKDLSKAWLTIDNYEFLVERFESDIDFAQITSQSESVLLITFEVSIGEKTYFMNLCFATFAFDHILQRLSNQKLSKIRPSKFSAANIQKIIRNNLNETTVPIRVEMGKTRITMDELMGLSKGDVIKLTKKIDEEYPVLIKDKLVFLGRPGLVNKHKAIKITKKTIQNSQ